VVQNTDDAAAQAPYREAGGVTVQGFGDLAERVTGAAARLGAVRMIAVDGPAGAGKTTFAGRLADAVRATGATVAEVHVDDLLEGWSGMATFWPRLERDVLAKLRAGHPGGYQRYDWEAARFGGYIAVAVPDVLFLEGVTSARSAIRAELTLSVFVSAPSDLRLARGIARDGESFRPQWLRWRVEEDRHFAVDRTVEHVDLLVDGAPTVPHDPRTEYLRRLRIGGRSG
jgi:uridine kinase